MPDPIRTPIPTQAPSTDPGRERRIDPGRICPEQKERLTRTIAPHLPE